MVRIRYAELPAGLHVTAETNRGDTVVYLQPGLTPAQRRAALIRVRSSARMGQGPTLPAMAMARAVATDRVRTTARIGAAAMRRHPMLFLPPLIVLVSSAAVFVLMSFVPVTVVHPGKSADGIPALHVDDRQTRSPDSHPSNGPSAHPEPSGPTHARHVRRLGHPPAASSAWVPAPSAGAPRHAPQADPSSASRRYPPRLSNSAARAPVGT